MASNRGAQRRKGKTMQSAEKVNKRPSAEARTKRNKAARAETREHKLQKRRDKFRDGLTVPEFKKLREARGW